MAEAPGEEEVPAQMPLVGSSGRLTSRMLSRIKDPLTGKGLILDDYSRGNTVNCFPGNQVVQASNIELGFRRWYSGLVITVKAVGGQLTGTPNHPILTDTGWVLLKDIKKGDNLVRGSLTQRMSSSNPYVDSRESSFVDLFDSLSESGISMRIVGRDMDFHGDGRQSDVDIVGENLQLLSHDLSSASQHCREQILKSSLKDSGDSPTLCSSLGTGDSAFEGSFGASDSIMSGGYSSLPIRRTGLSVPELERFRSTSSVAPGGLNESLDSFPGKMNFSGNSLNGLPRIVEISQVLDVYSTHFSGHVYNLQTSSGEYITNGFIVHNCRTPGLNLSDDPACPELVEHWRPISRKLLEEEQPSVVFAMGAYACEFFLGDLFDEVKEWRGYVEEFDWGWGPFHVVFSYHPSFLMHGNFSLCEMWQFDFKRALSVLRNGWHPAPVHYLLSPTPQQAREFFEEWRAAGLPTLAFDIETPYSNNEEELAEDDLLEDIPDASWDILRISFSFKEKEAITMPWQPPYIEMALDALAAATFSCVWNAPFDCPRLERAAEKAGKVIFTGYVCDAMDAHKFFKPHIPRRLKYCATLWTDVSQWAARRGQGEEYYSCVDSDVLLRIFNKVKEALEKAGRWDLFHRHYTVVMKILRKMSRRGILVDRPEMEAAFGRLSKRLEAQTAKLQAAFPLHLKKEVEWRGSEKKRPLAFAWYRKEVPLTEKEILREAKRAEKEKEKAAKKLLREEQRAAKKAAKAAEKEEKKRKKNGTP